MKKLALFSTLICLMAALSWAAIADSISLTWDTPTSREDGTALAFEEIESYKLSMTHEGAESIVNVPADNNTYQANNLSAGAYEFKIATVSGGVAGPYSPIETVTLSSNASSPVITRVIVERCTPEGVCTQEVIK